LTTISSGGALGALVVAAREAADGSPAPLWLAGLGGSLLVAERLVGLWQRALLFRRGR
jgi:hypothetical protein